VPASTASRAHELAAFEYDVAVFVAITRGVSPAFAACELTHLERVPIDVERARAQHHAYEQALIAAGAMICQLDASADLPDSVFVEDVAVVLPEVAVITRPGAPSRRGERPAVAHALAAFRPLRTIERPATIDGGDVLVAGRTVFVGQSTRTNGAAVAQLRQILAPFGYTVCTLEVDGCLHLKSAATALDATTLLVNPSSIDTGAFGGFTLIPVDPREPHAANALRLSDRVIFPRAFPRTAASIERLGWRVERVEVDELAKAEGAVTCCSLIVDAASAAGPGTRVGERHG
jgi:dimethylargininase